VAKTSNQLSRRVDAAHRGRRSRGSADLGQRPGRAPLHLRRKWLAWESVQTGDCGPRPAATMERSKEPGQRTVAAAHAGRAHRVQASGECGVEDGAANHAAHCSGAERRPRWMQPVGWPQAGVRRQGLDCELVGSILAVGSCVHGIGWAAVEKFRGRCKPEIR